MQIDGMNIIYIIVYNSWTTIMPFRGSRSPVEPFSDQNVFLYARSFYSVIHILYSLIIHCFNGKELWYALKKLEYTRIVLIIAYYAMNILYDYSFLYYWEWFLLLNQYVYIDIDYCLFVSIECIDIYSDIVYWL